MTHTYQVTGMTCTGCEATVKSALLTVANVTSVEVSKDENSVTIVMDKHINLFDLQKALNGNEGKYHILAIQHSEIAEQTKGWFATYKPIAIIFSYITLVSVLIQLGNNHLDFMQWMRHCTLSFFDDCFWIVM